MKILAKRKRGNKYSTRWNGTHGQRRGNKLGNKSLKGMNVLGAYGENGQ